MLQTIIFEDQIKIWWEYNSETARKGYYIVKKDGKEYLRTDKTHCTILDLLPNTKYSFEVELFNQAGESICHKQVIATTSKQKEKIDVTQAPYFACGDGKTLNTRALQRAINDCKEGQYVYFPQGVYLSGALYLHGDMEVRLDKKAVLQGVKSPEDYLPKVWSRFEGIEMECYASLINIGRLNHKDGYTTKNIVIRGGKICGGGEELRKKMIERAKIDFDCEKTPTRRRGRLISVHNAQNIVLSDIEAGNSPAWNVHMVYCDNVVTCGGKIYSQKISNGDGWDPDSSTNCVLFDVEFDTGDDCVAIKSGKNPEGNLINRACEHIRVFDCRANGGNGIAIGSEMSGGIEDVKIWDCDIETSFAGLNIKSTPSRGGYIKNVSVYHLKTSKIFFRTSMNGNDDGASADTLPRLENFVFEDITITGIETYTDNQRIDKANAIDVIGYQKNKLKGLVLRNIRLLYRPMLPYHWINLEDVEDVEIENIICESYMENI